MDIYLQYAEKLLRGEFGYVCKCSAEKFKKLRDNSEECPCRSKSVLENISDWSLMNDGAFNEGEAVVRVKTSMDLPNPALRDWPALRIQHSEHPMVGKKIQSLATTRFPKRNRRL